MTARTVAALERREAAARGVTVARMMEEARGRLSVTVRDDGSRIVTDGDQS